MGVFDDAIREHLELKRAKGADEAELKELEDEAFGQAARPGDPDFPGSTSEEEAVEAGPVEGGTLQPESEAAEADSPAPEESSKPFDVGAETTPAEQTALTPAEETSEQEIEPPPAETASEEAPVLDEPASEEDPALDEPAEVDPESEPVSPFSTAEREAIADQPTVFFDQAPAELELGDLELDFDEEIEEVGGSVSEPLPDEEESLGVEDVFADEPAAEVAEPPHEVEPEPAPPEEPAPLEPPPSEPEPEAPDAPEEEPSDPVTSDFSPPAEEGEPVTGEDDVLEETPEFLRDNPDDDELWFEQGEPKDFDF